MINYWPRRENVKGFTKSLAKKVKERLAHDPFKEQLKVEEQIALKLGSQVKLEVGEQVINIVRPRVGIGHWANRGFEEYKRAA